MELSGTLFLFVFLPTALGIYYISRDKARDYILLFLSLIFYALGSLKYLEFFTVDLMLTVLLGRLMASSGEQWIRKLLLILGTCLNVGLLIYFKYTDFAILQINRVTGGNLPFRLLALPLGISFFTFKAISYLADIYSETAKLSPSPIHDALYLSFFPQMTSGPLTRYNDMRTCNGGTLFADGVCRFMIGFNKKILLANVLANITNEIFSTSCDNLSTAYAWLGAVCYSLQLYYDFSGYSDMAIGLSRMFGYDCMENFNFPYMTESISLFWRRWHISLGNWFRDYIYIPMGGSRSSGKYTVYRNLFVVWLLTGIWHGAAWKFVVWGMGYFVMISFERITGLPKRLKNRPLKLLYRVLALLFITFEWVIFRADSLTIGLKFIKNMIVFKTLALSDQRTLFLIRDNAAFLLLAVLLCFPVVSAVGERVKSREKAYLICQICTGVIIASAFILSLSFIVAGQNNPFVYANF